MCALKAGRRTAPVEQLPAVDSLGDIWKHICLGPRKPRRIVTFIFCAIQIHLLTYLRTNCGWWDDMVKWASVPNANGSNFECSIIASRKTSSISRWWGHGWMDELISSTAVWRGDEIGTCDKDGWIWNEHNQMDVWFALKYEKKSASSGNCWDWNQSVWWL